MSAEEIKRRFRLALLGYVILAVACIAGLAVNYAQQQDIKNNQDQLRKAVVVLAKRDCKLLTSTVGVFVDFLQREITLRQTRVQSQGVSEAVRNFDEAQIYDWTNLTLPALRRVYVTNCEAPLPH